MDRPPAAPFTPNDGGLALHFSLPRLSTHRPANSFAARALSEGGLSLDVGPNTHLRTVHVARGAAGAQLFRNE